MKKIAFWTVVLLVASISFAEDPVVGRSMVATEYGIVR